MNRRVVKIRDEWIEAAAKAIHAESCCPCDKQGCDYPDELAKEIAAASLALEAVAPLIAAQALTEAADEWQTGGWAADPIRTGATRATAWLRARAATLIDHQKEKP